MSGILKLMNIRIIEESGVVENDFGQRVHVSAFVGHGVVW